MHANSSDSGPATAREPVPRSADATIVPCRLSALRPNHALLVPDRRHDWTDCSRSVAADSGRGVKVWCHQHFTICDQHVLKLVGLRRRIESSVSQTDPVTAVAGSWVVPTVRCPQGTSSYSCVWVGIDGWTYPSGGGTVEQVGTEQDVINGVPRYYAWWEMYSANGARVPGQRYQYQINAMTISPGDPINASVTYITTGTYAGDFLLSIVDTNRANDFYSTYQRSYQTQNPQPLRNSAEWIVENTQENGSLTTSELRNRHFHQYHVQRPGWPDQLVSVAVNTSEYGLEWSHGSLDIGTV